MDERLFSHIAATSARAGERAKVEQLRESSKDIINKIKAKPDLYVISGLRGVGKTTILSELSKSIEKSIYLNGDIIVKYGVDLLELLHYSEGAGYSTFMIDEVHAIANWERDVKIFHDETHSDMVITGSSAVALKVKGSELSRRATLFELKTMSLREYLSFKTGTILPKVSMENLTDGKILPELTKSIMPYMNEVDSYVRRNALPACFFDGKPEVYINIVERVVRYDLQALREIDAQYIDAVFKVIKFVASSSPGEVSYTKIANTIQRSTRIAQEMVRMLAYSGLFYIIPPEGAGYKGVRSEDKILMPLSFRAALCEEYGVVPSSGGLREDFFIQHVDGARYIKTGVERRTPDYVVGDNVFEVGGESKGWSQLKNRKNAYLVKETLVVRDNEIPLWLFGFLY
ncbi:MAG: AAA family ATPase [Candidatus Micrarchaeota archaeon]|nr:AAA family ATPase [Candidatus Micrarchaeota archaeon]